jgi:alpha-D-xyloside xylohydrolase
MRALVLMHQNDKSAREAEDEYYFGPDLLVAPVVTPLHQRAVYLPAGNWVDYWTGRCIEGGQTVVAEAPLDRIPLFILEGTVLPKIPEDVMTLVPREQVSNRNVHTLDDRRVYEIWAGSSPRSFADFEGRKLAYDPTSRTLAIDGPPARVTIRFRFAHPSRVMVNGRAADQLTTTPDGASLELHHIGSSKLSW